ARTGVNSETLIGEFNASHEFVSRVPRVKCTLIPGSARVSRVGESVPFSRTFRGRLFRRDAPKPTRETRALPGLIALDQSDKKKCASLSDTDALRISRREFTKMLTRFDIAPSPAHDVFLFLERKRPLHFCRRTEN